MRQPPADRSHLTLPPRALIATARALRVIAFAVIIPASAPMQAQSRPAVHKVPPTYPPIARQMRITGTVVVTTTVDPAGRVLKAESTSGNKLLSPSAIEAVKQWKFAPGDAIATFPVSVSFEMN